jgi:hypothetical protein
VLQERADQRRVEVGEVKAIRRFAGLVLREAEEQAE